MNKARKHASAYERRRAHARKLTSSVLQPVSAFCIAACCIAAKKTRKTLISLTYAKSGI